MSIYLGEAIGLSNLEGLAYGLPIVGSAVGGIPEVIQDGYNGYLFPRGNAAAMAARVEQSKADPERRSSMASISRAMAVERYSIECQVGEYLE